MCAENLSRGSSLNERLEICAVGDILLYGRYDRIAAEGQADAVFAAVRPLFAESALVVGNLECPLTEAGQPREDKLCLRGSPRYGEALKAAGFDVLSLANNHLFDFGDTGARDTRRHLEAAGLLAVGAGDDLAAARRPVIVERQGIRLGFLAYCHASTGSPALAASGKAGVAPLELDRVLEDIEKLKPAVDHVVLLLHWGLEYSPLPTPDQIAQAHAAIDRGASLVIGAHSHCLQGIEPYGRGLIAYSLANFTDSDVDFAAGGKTYAYTMRDVDRESALLRVTLSKTEVLSFETVPLWLDDAGRPGPAEPPRAGKIADALGQRGAALKNKDIKRHWEEDLVDRRVLAPFIRWWQSGSLWDKIRGFRPGQLVTLYLLAATFVRIRFSRGEARWSLFSSRNDARPMPTAGSAGDGPEPPARSP
jgi:hypothetical protein